MFLRKLAFGWVVLAATLGIVCTDSQATSTMMPSSVTPQVTQSTASPTTDKTSVPTTLATAILDPTPTSTLLPTFDQAGTPTVMNDVDQAQGIFGTVLMVPGVCLPDPVNEGECLNKPVPGQGHFDVREYADSPDVGYSNPIVVAFESEHDGFYSVGLPPGEYCVWFGNGCEAQIEISSGIWLDVTLYVYLP